jgi:hypothetical protein
MNDHINCVTMIFVKETASGWQMVENNHLSSMLWNARFTPWKKVVCVHPGHYSLSTGQLYDADGKCGMIKDFQPLFSFGGNVRANKLFFVSRAETRGASTMLFPVLHWSEPCPVNAIHLNTSSGSSSPVTVEAEGQAHESLQRKGTALLQTEQGLVLSRRVGVVVSKQTKKRQIPEYFSRMKL